VVVQTANSTNKYFVSGGFVAVGNDSTCDLTSIEAVPVADLDLATIRTELDYYNGLATNATTPESRAIASVGVDVFKAMQAAAESN